MCISETMTDIQFSTISKVRYLKSEFQHFDIWICIQYPDFQIGYLDHYIVLLSLNNHRFTKLLSGLPFSLRLLMVAFFFLWSMQVTNILPLKGGPPPKFTQKVQLYTENYQVVWWNPYIGILYPTFVLALF